MKKGENDTEILVQDISRDREGKGRKREKRQGDFGTGYRDSEGKGTKDREIWVQDIKIEKEKGSKREKKGEKGRKDMEILVQDIEIEKEKAERIGDLGTGDKDKD